jgi:hypothetical protein
MSFALRNRLIHVNCPRDNYENPAEVIGSQQTAFATFRSLCPPAAEVASVVGIRKKGRQHKCAWKVRYIRGDNNQIGSEQLARDIMNSKPQNTEIVRKDKHIYLPAIEMDYSITCDCIISPHAGKLIKKDDPVEKIKVELINLKVEEE